MQEKTLARGIAWARIALGGVAVIIPRPAARILTGRSDIDGVGPQLARMVGARDVALGLGTLIALEREQPVRGWLEAAALADGGDCVSALLGRKQMGRSAFIGTVVSASVAAVLGLLLARRVDGPA